MEALGLNSDELAIMFALIGKADFGHVCFSLPNAEVYFVGGQANGSHGGVKLRVETEENGSLDSVEYNFPEGLFASVLQRIRSDAHIRKRHGGA